MKSRRRTSTGGIDWEQIITPLERLRALLARRTPTKPIDWKEVHERLERARIATEESLCLSPEKARKVMEERADELAKVPVRAPHATEILELVSFSLANEHYAIETRYVREVVRFTDFTPIPGAPDFLVGLLNLRGDILAVFDLRKFFGVVDKGVTDLSRVIAIGGERVEFGILADVVFEVMTVRIGEVFEPPGSVAGIGREYLRGVTREALIVLDGGVLLQAARFFIDQADESGG